MKLTITIESNNAVFDDGAGGRLEAGSILADIADRLRLMPLDSVFPLRDSNGNKVGEIVLADQGQIDVANIVAGSPYHLATLARLAALAARPSRLR